MYAVMQSENIEWATHPHTMATGPPDMRPEGKAMIIDMKAPIEENPIEID